jgi:hypothetical protein
MFAKVYQSGDTGVEIFSPAGSGDPLKIFQITNESMVQREYDRGVKGNILNMETESTTTKIHCPKSLSSLHITQPLFCFQLLLCEGKPFSFECVVVDQNRQRKRFHFSTHFREKEFGNALHAKLTWPKKFHEISFEGRWFNIIINLQQLCSECFPTSHFQLLESFIFHPSCKIRKIFSLPLSALIVNDGIHDNVNIPAAFDFPVGCDRTTFIYNLSLIEQEKQQTLKAGTMTKKQSFSGEKEQTTKNLSSQKFKVKPVDTAVVEEKTPEKLHSARKKEESTAAKTPSSVEMKSQLSKLKGKKEDIAAEKKKFVIRQREPQETEEEPQAVVKNNQKKLESSTGSKGRGNLHEDDNDQRVDRNIEKALQFSEKKLQLLQDEEEENQEQETVPVQKSISRSPPRPFSVTKSKSATSPLQTKIIESEVNDKKLQLLQDEEDSYLPVQKSISRSPPRPFSATKSKSAASLSPLQTKIIESEIGQLLERKKSTPRLSAAREESVATFSTSLSSLKEIPSIPFSYSKGSKEGKSSGSEPFAFRQSSKDPSYFGETFPADDIRQNNEQEIRSLLNEEENYVPNRSMENEISFEEHSHKQHSDQKQDRFEDSRDHLLNRSEDPVDVTNHMENSDPPWIEPNEHHGDQQFQEIIDEKDDLPFLRNTSFNSEGLNVDQSQYQQDLQVEQHNNMIDEQYTHFKEEFSTRLLSNNTLSLEDKQQRQEKLQNYLGIVTQLEKEFIRNYGIHEYQEAIGVLSI